MDAYHQPGLFWLTGSQQFHVMHGVSESLAGRVAVVHFLGLSHREWLGQGQAAQPFLPIPADVAQRTAQGGRITLPELYNLIWRGALPAIALNESLDRDLFYSSYVQTYLTPHRYHSVDPRLDAVNRAKREIVKIGAAAIRID